MPWLSVFWSMELQADKLKAQIAIKVILEKFMFRPLLKPHRHSRPSTGSG
jgi:hypothetical protein